MVCINGKAATCLDAGEHDKRLFKTGHFMKKNSLIGMLALLSLGIIFLLKPRGEADEQDLNESEHELIDLKVRAAGGSRELPLDQIEESRYDGG